MKRVQSMWRKQETIARKRGLLGGMVKPNGFITTRDTPWRPLRVLNSTWHSMAAVTCSLSRGCWLSRVPEPRPQKKKKKHCKPRICTEIWGLPWCKNLWRFSLFKLLIIIVFLHFIVLNFFCFLCLTSLVSFTGSNPEIEPKYVLLKFIYFFLYGCVLIILFIVLRVSFFISMTQSPLWSTLILPKKLGSTLSQRKSGASYNKQLTRAVSKGHDQIAPFR